MSALPATRAGATPVLADQWEADALQAIDAVVDPEQAESLLARIKVAEQAIRLSRLGGDRERRWGRVRLLGERRYGELLGPAEHSRRPEVVTGSNNLPAERKAQHEARQVADVPEPVFAEYVETAGQPTRAGLLRESNRMAVHYSSHTDEWATPPELFAVIAREFRFDVDVCALPVSAKCARYFTPEDDGLAQEWSGTCWMNPPYGAQIGRWVTKAHLSADAGAIVVCLVPARTDTGWWWDHCRHAEIRFLRGRLRFGEAETGAPFPSAIVVFGRPARVIWWEPERSLRVAA